MLNFEFGYPSVAPMRRYFWQAIGAAVGSIGNAISNNHANKYNARLMREQMAWQTGEREAQQAYQTSEREAQNAFAEQMYNNYSSPAAMARQYAEAGLNPRLAMDSSNVGSVTSGSGSNGGAPSGQGAPAPAYIPQNNLASGFSNIASALASLGQAKKAGVETRMLESQFNDLVAKTKYEAETQKFIALFEKPLDVMLKKKGVQKLLVEIANGQLQAEEIKERIHSLKLDNDLKLNELDHWLETWQVELNKTKAETDLNVAKSQESKDVHELFPLNKKGLERTNNLLDEQIREKRISNDVAEETKSAQIQITKALAIRGTHEAVYAYQQCFEKFISNTFYQRYGTKEFNTQINMTAASLWEMFQDSLEYRKFTNEMYKAFGFSSPIRFRDFLADFDPIDIDIPSPDRPTEPHDH